MARLVVGGAVVVTPVVAPVVEGAAAGVARGGTTLVAGGGVKGVGAEPLGGLDQTLAGVILKLGGGLILWSFILVIWMKWYKTEKTFDDVVRNSSND